MSGHLYALLGPLKTRTAVPRAAAVLVFVSAGAVLAGWAFDIATLGGVVPGAASRMKPNTALCFLLSGVSLWLASAAAPGRLRRRASVACAIVVGAVGGLTSFAYLSGLDLGIDRILVRHAVSAAGTSEPGRMAPFTALSFILVGGSLALVSARRRRAVAASHALVLPAAFFAFVVLLGFLYAVIPGRVALESDFMSIHTTLLFLIVAAGVLHIEAEDWLGQSLIYSETTGGVLLRTLLPATTGLLILIGYVRLIGQWSGLYDTEFAVSLGVAASIALVAALIYFTARELDRTDRTRLQAEQALREAHADLERQVAIRTALHAESAAHFRAVAEAATDAIVSIDASGRIVFLNRAAEVLFGYSFAEAEGKPLTTLMPERFRAGHRRALGRYLESGTSALIGSVAEVVGMKKDGSEFPMEVSLSTWETNSGEFFTGIVRDISKRKHFERLRNDFVLMLTHDLRNALQVIIGFTSIIQEEGQDDPELTQSLLARIQRAAWQTLTLSANFVDYAYIQEGPPALRREKASLNDIVRSAVREQYGAAHIQGAVLEMDLGEDVPEMMLDRSLLQRIVANLLGNAIKFSPAGGRIRVTTARRNGLVVMTVEDQGLGISAEDRPGLFDRFARFATSEHASSGLGLFIVKSFVEAHGGHVEVECPPSGGSIFRVSLPLPAEGGESLPRGEPTPTGNAPA